MESRPIHLKYLSAHEANPRSRLGTYLEVPPTMRAYQTIQFLCASAFLVTAGCDIGLSQSTGPNNGGGDDDVPFCESYPLGEPRDPETLDACCPDYGDAHCLPSEVVPEFLAGLVATCDSGGVCVPDPFIAKGGLHVPKDCTVDVDGSTGVCMSGCIPEVGQYAGILKQDVCDSGEFCTPCVSPLDGSDTGACALRENICGADIGGPGGGSGGVCPYEGPPLIDPASFPTCDQCGDASCVDKNLVPVDFHSRLNECDSDSFCVPNELVETAGNFIPTTCTAVAGFEGRCLSECLPEVQERADLLSQATCATSQLCVPCFDPLTGASTGACDLSCDPGADPAGPTQLPACCEGRGTCIPGELAGEDADQLGQDSCSEESGLLCAPNDIINGTFVATSCTTGGIIGGGEDGACLPDCLGAVDSILVGQGDCSDGFKCAPCEGPFGGDTGACDYLAP